MTNLSSYIWLAGRMTNLSSYIWLAGRMTNLSSYIWLAGRMTNLSSYIWLTGRMHDVSLACMGWEWPGAREREELGHRTSTSMECSVVARILCSRYGVRERPMCIRDSDRI